MSHPFARFVVVLMLFAGPLEARDASAPATAAGLPDVVLRPDLERVLRDYERAWSAGDAAALASLFAEDGFVLQGNRQPVRGRAAIQAAYEGQGGGEPLRLRALAFGAGDTVGYIIGGYRYGDASSDMGKFTLTLVRSPGGPWMIFSDMDNANAPQRRKDAPGAAASAPAPASAPVPVPVPVPVPAPATGR